MGVVARQSIKGSVANYLGVAIGFVTTFFVLTDCLSQEEIGLTRVLVDAATLLASLAQLGTNSTLVRFFPQFSDGGRNRGVFGLSLVLPTVGFLILALILLLFRSQITGLYLERSPLIKDYYLLLLPLLFFVLYITVCEANANVLMRITVPKLIREVGIRLMNLCSYLLYGYGVISFNVFVLLFTASYGVALLLNLCYLVALKRVSLKPNLRAIERTQLRDMLRYSLFMTVLVVAGNSQFLGSLFIGAKEGLALTGVYTIAFFIANVVEVPGRSLSAISRPPLAAAVNAGNRSEASKIVQNVSLHQFLVALLILALIWINLDLLFDLIPNGSGYRQGKWVVLLLGLAKLTNSTFCISADFLSFSRHYRISLPLVLLLSCMVIAFNYWLVDLWSINGAAAALLLSLAIYYAILLAYLRAKEGVSLFSTAQAKVLLVGAVVLGGDMLWNISIQTLFGSGIMPQIINGIVKTLVLSSAAIWLTYTLKLSLHINSIIDKVLRHKI